MCLSSVDIRQLHPSLLGEEKEPIRNTSYFTLNPWKAQEFETLVSLRVGCEVGFKTGGLAESLQKKQLDFLDFSLSCGIAKWLLLSYPGRILVIYSLEGMK